jgi:TIR domain
MENKSVFISYSHDSPEHKKWVGRLASDLVRNGIDVFIDQWDVALGDDLIKYMEKSIIKSDRVLMVCSDIYTRKANDGIGGVGYESMIVTGEMVKNIGTKKFIPLIRQSTSEKIIPNFLSTRLYCDFSEDEQYSIKLEDLMREIYQTPLFPKPELGVNPFTKPESQIEIEKDAIENVRGEQESESFVLIARSIIENDNMNKWRELIRSLKKDYSKELSDWFVKYNSIVPQDLRQIEPIILEAVQIFEPLIEISIAGFESGNKKYASHSAFMDEIIYLKNWRRSGYTVYTNVEKTIAYIFQALHGATGMLLNNIEMIDSFIYEIVTIDEKRNYLWKTTSIVGFPESFGRSSKGGWDALKMLFEKWKWLNDIFGSYDEYIASLSSYYMYLSFIEFLDFLTVDKAKLAEYDTLMLDIPVFFLGEQENEKKAYRQLLRNKDHLKSKLLGLNKDNDDIIEYWKIYYSACQKWLGDGFAYRFNVPLFSKLPYDLLNIL